MFTPLRLLQDKAYVDPASQIWVFTWVWLAACGDDEVQLNSSQATAEVSVMEMNVKKQTPRVYYLGIVVVFAVLILWAFLRIAGQS